METCVRYDNVMTNVLRFQDSLCLSCRKLFAIVILLVLYLSLFTWHQTEIVWCYYSTLGDALPPNVNISSSTNSIFFLETACAENLSSRQACAIESAARAHLDHQIQVLFTGPIKQGVLNGNLFTVLGDLKNVKFGRVLMDEYAKGTPIERVVTYGALDGSQWWITHTSDVLRYLALYKWGGVYLDLDVVVVKRFDTLASNWAARESSTDVAAGAMAFSKDKIGREVAIAAAREIQTNFRGDIWGHNGPGVITRVLKRMCTTTNVTLMSAATCKGFEVYGPELFYPIEWQNGKDYFVAGKLKNEKAYVYHVWNHLTKDMKVDDKSPYAELARRYCPSTYELYGDQFGT